MEQGLRVVASSAHYGTARDALIGRSRVWLNCHQFSPTDPLEVLRLLVGWANRAAIVSAVDRLDPGATGLAGRGGVGAV